MPLNPSALEVFFNSSILPSLGGKPALSSSQSLKRKDLIDLNISRGKGDPLAEIRFDLLSSPATLHLFIHHYPIEKGLKQAIIIHLHQMEMILGKRIKMDTSYSDALHRLTFSTHKIAKELEEFRKSLSALTKVHHTTGFPKYGYPSLPPSFKGFGDHLPTSLTLELYRGKILPKAALRLHFDGLHDPQMQSCIIHLPPYLYKEVMGVLKQPLNRLQDRMGTILKKAIHTEYRPMAKA